MDKNTILRVETLSFSRTTSGRKLRDSSRRIGISTYL